MRVVLDLLYSEDTGDYGALPTGSLENNFSPFWDGNSGIFHDVFEHYFEDVYPYFKGTAAYNLGGEIAATGHCAYYMHEGFGRTSVRGDWMSDRDMIAVIANQIIDALKYDSDTFGQCIISSVPYQKPGCSIIENIIIEYFSVLEDKFIYPCDEINTQHVKNLFRWGYRRAKAIAPHGTQNVLQDFIGTWNDFCKDNSAEEVCRIFDRLEFNITTGKNLRWTARFRDRYGKKWINYRNAHNHLLY